MEQVEENPPRESKSHKAINDVIQREVTETIEEFEARRRLAIMILSVEKPFEVTTLTALVISGMIMQKLKLGTTYPREEETIIAYFINELMGY